MPATKFNLGIEQGRNLNQVVRWESEPFSFATIKAISKSAPINVETFAAHGLVDGWRVAVVGAKGMTLLNAQGNPPKSKDFRRVTMVDPTHVEFNSMSSALEPSYSGGGFLQWYTPVDMASFTARMTIKDKIGGSALLTLTTENSKLLIDNVAKTITMALTAIETAALTWVSGVYDLEMVSPTGAVTAILSGSVSVTKEVTT